MEMSSTKIRRAAFLVLSISMPGIVVLCVFVCFPVVSFNDMCNVPCQVLSGAYMCLYHGGERGIALFVYMQVI